MSYAEVSSNILFNFVASGTLLVEYPSYDLMFMRTLTPS